MAALRTFFEKVWEDHAVADLGDNTSLLQIDRLFLHELNGSVVIDKLEKAGRGPDSPRQVFGVVDHLVSTRTGRTRDETSVPGGVELIQKMRRQLDDYVMTLFDTHDLRQGIVHVISPELGIALPGVTLATELGRCSSSNAFL